MNVIEQLNQMYTDNKKIKDLKKHYNLEKVKQVFLENLTQTEDAETNEILGIKYGYFDSMFELAHVHFQKSIASNRLQGYNEYANFLCDVLNSDDCMRYFEMGKSLGCLDCVYNMAMYLAKKPDLRYVDEFLYGAQHGDAECAEKLIDYYYKKNNVLYERYLLEFNHLSPAKFSNSLGMFYDDNNMNDLAELYYTKAVDLDDENAMYNLGIMYKKQKKTSMMKKLFKRAIAKNETYSMYTLAYHYYELGLYQKAKKYFKMYVHHSDENDGYNGLGNTYFKLGNYTKMRQNYNIAINRGYSVSMVEYGDFCELQLANQPDCTTANAIKYYKMAIDLNNKSAMTRLGNLYKNKMDFVKAEQYYMMAITHNYYFAYLRLAELSILQRKYDMMIYYYEQALANKVNFDLCISEDNMEVYILLTDFAIRKNHQAEKVLHGFMSKMFPKLDEKMTLKYNKMLKNILIEEFNLKFKKLSVAKPVFSNYEDVKFQ